MEKTRVKEEQRDIVYIGFSLDQESIAASYIHDCETVDAEILLTMHDANDDRMYHLGRPRKEVRKALMDKEAQYL